MNIKRIEIEDIVTLSEGGFENLFLRFRFDAEIVDLPIKKRTTDLSFMEVLIETLQNQFQTTEKFEVDEMFINFKGFEKEFYRFADCIRNFEVHEKILKSIFIKKIRFENLRNCQNIFLWFSNIYSHEIEIGNIDARKIIIGEAPYKTTVNLSGNNIDEFLVLNIRPNGQLIVDDGSIKRFQILWETVGFINQLQLRHLNIDQFVLGDGMQRSLKNMSLLNCHFGNLHIRDVLFDSFFVRQSTCDTCHLYSIKFPKTRDKFTLKEFYIKEGQLINIDWGNYFSDYQGEGEITDRFSANALGEVKEIYRMFKYLYDEIGNKTEANKFFAKEMEYHMKSLKEKGRTMDYWIAKFQQIISDFGNDWFRALGWYFVVCLIGIIGVYSSHLYNFPISEGLVENSLWKTIIQYLNPLPKTDEVPSFWYMFIMIIKLLVVYQIGTSLRRISQR